MKYTHSEKSTPDGLCFETIVQNAEHIDIFDASLKSPILYGKLSVDSHSVKEQFCKQSEVSIVLSICIMLT